MSWIIVVLDTETGGLDALRCSLLSLAAVAFEVTVGQPWHELGRFVARIRAEAGLVSEAKALEINGLDPDEGQPEGEAVRAFADWLAQFDGYILGGQNVAFDVAFLKAALARQQVEVRLSHRTFDLISVAMAAAFSGRMAPPEKFSLDAIAASQGMRREGATHDACEDAVLTASLMERLL